MTSTINFTTANKPKRRGPPPAAEQAKKLLAHLASLKKRSRQQDMLLSLAGIANRTPQQQKTFDTLLRAEKAADRAVRAATKAAKIVNAKARAERRQREQGITECAELLVLAGLLDDKTGHPIWETSELLGALIEIANQPQKKSHWKSVGQARLAQKKLRRSSKENPEEEA
ncbi:hypothetical protein E3E12_02400 [Formicincola oecophyllae]|uniref:Conjugal transfer protein TraD n=1 Tax=Formicincola oecophyllae TaxID=2558361 RepID=A0A4Y6UA43_9PROT|nr:conjugal transfer protein TraD [Formicincola oecophyllae]QDH13241.1 hypothetical protein E3E12_02400 [Formicincola oecophyllae]